MEQNLHMRVVRYAKIAMFVVFGVNLARIFVRTWLYGGSKRLYTKKITFADGSGAEGTNDVPPDAPKAMFDVGQGG